MEDNEKASREELSDRTEGLFTEIQDMVKRSCNPEVNKQGLEMDEVSVKLLICAKDSESLMNFTRMRTKMKSVFEQYELRELIFHSLLHTKDWEVHQERAKADDQRKKADTETLKARTLSTQVSTFSQTETELRNQLNIYVEKFKQACCPTFSSSKDHRDQVHAQIVRSIFRDAPIQGPPSVWSSPEKLIAALLRDDF